MFAVTTRRRRYARLRQTKEEKKKCKKRREEKRRKQGLVWSALNHGRSTAGRGCCLCCLVALQASDSGIQMDKRHMASMPQYLLNSVSAE